MHASLVVKKALAHRHVASRADLSSLMGGTEEATLSCGMQVVINMDKLKEEAQADFQGADVVFCTLGTTRGDAGSAEQFLKVGGEGEAAGGAGASKQDNRSLRLGRTASVWADDLRSTTNTSRRRRRPPRLGAPSTSAWSRRWAQTPTSGPTSGAGILRRWRGSVAVHGGAGRWSTAAALSARCWTARRLVFAPLLYTQTKGRAEEAAKAQGFPFTTIFR